MKSHKNSIKPTFLDFTHNFNLSNDKQYARFQNAVQDLSEVCIEHRKQLNIPNMWVTNTLTSTA